MAPLYSDDERLAMLEALGAVTVSIDETDVLALFVNEHAEALEIDGTSPMLRCRQSDLSGIGRGSEVTVPDAGEFLVRRVRPDSSGFAFVDLTVYGA